MRYLNREDLKDLVLGSSILGGGGGGQVEEGLSYLEKAFSKTPTIKLVSLPEIPDSTILACPYRIGSVVKPDDASAGTVREPLLEAIHALETTQAGPITGFIPAEIGPLNTLLPFFAAASVENGFVVDADPSGRSVPEMRHLSIWRGAFPPRTIAACTGAGLTRLFTGVNGPEEAESHLRRLSAETKGGLYSVDHAFSKGTLAPFLHKWTVSEALRVGYQTRRSRERGVDVAEAIAEIGGGRLVFRGRLENMQGKEEGGFLVGEYEICGSGDFEGRRFRVTYKNENMAGWMDGKLCVTIPEIICLVDGRGVVVVNGGPCRIDDVIAVVVLPAPKHFLTENGLRIFGPRYCGLQGEFKSALCQGC